MPLWNCIATFRFVPCQTKAGINTFNESTIFLGNDTKKGTIVFHITLSHFSMPYSTVHTQDYSADSLNYIIFNYWMCLLLLTHNSGCLNKQCMVIMPLSPLNSSKTASSQLPSALFSCLITVYSYQWNMKLGIRCYLMGNGL